MERTRSWTVEMLWKCGGCGKICPGMRGSERESLKCSTCGYEKKASDPWIMPDSPEAQPHLTGELDHKARAGKNWSCQYCGAESRADRVKCEVCGADRAKPATTATKKTTVTATADPHRTPAPVATELDAAPAVGATVFMVAMMLLAMVAIGGGIYYLVSPNDSVVRVTDTHWRRTETLMERHDSSGSSWQSDEPGGVFYQSCEPRQNGTHACNPHDCRCHLVDRECNCTGGEDYPCHCHEVCSRRCRSNQNGAATCTESCRDECETCTTPRRCQNCPETECATCWDECPTMDTWCNYQYHHWDRIDQHVADRHDSEPMWPEPLFTPNGPLQRVDRAEQYQVRFVDTSDASNAWDRTYNEAQFRPFVTGQRWNLRWTHGGEFTLLGRAP